MTEGLQTENYEFSNRAYKVPSEISWYAIQTQFRLEKKVALELQQRGVDVFLPLRWTKNKWSDRQRLVSFPLFPGYAFVRVSSSQNERVKILRTNGVTGLVGAKGLGTAIPDSEMEAVQAIVKHEIPFQLSPYLSAGQSVRIRGGALDGVEGVLVRQCGDESVVVSIQLLQRSLSIRVEGFGIEAV